MYIFRTYVFIYYGDPVMEEDDMIDNLDEIDTVNDRRFTEKDGQIYYRDFVKYVMRSSFKFEFRPSKQNYEVSLQKRTASRRKRK